MTIYSECYRRDLGEKYRFYIFGGNTDCNDLYNKDHYESDEAFGFVKVNQGGKYDDSRAEVKPEDYQTIRDRLN